MSSHTESTADAGTLGYFAACITTRGKIGDGGVPSRPWLTFEVSERETAEEARAAFMYTGSISSREKQGRTFYRYSLYGNDALFALRDLLPHFRGEKLHHARHLLKRWGKGGEPYASETERLEDQGRSYDHKPGHPQIKVDCEAGRGW